MSDKQIFIVGTGRSGTSILKKILNHHSKIYTYPKELRFISDTDGLIDLRRALTTDWNPHNTSSTIKNFVTLLTRDLFMTNLPDRILNWLFVNVFSGSGKKYSNVTIKDFIPIGHIKKCLDLFLNNLGIEIISGYWYGSKSYQLKPKLYFSRPLTTNFFNKEAGKFTERLLSYPLQTTEASCWCDDTPMNILYADSFPLMFENAKVIHLFRNPLDVVASYTDLGQSWAPSNPKLAACWVVDILNRWKEIKRNLPPHCFLEVKYESLIQNQQLGLKKIMDFLELEYQNSLMNIQLHKGSVGRYKEDFSSDQLIKVKEILSQELKDFEQF
ncbi:Sulfotransferase family protein [Fodinibius roseus]|uniref:Sulfotransferase family protein n=1 Tax=Fodinibius roseus TaxID=1194090 RepID=A0A1M5J324_9BACT|nr:sulfotransferase [Fodinibius roseus]SHG34996.1 Sulfotransferase family protein [Fodinibius roseus]